MPTMEESASLLKAPEVAEILRVSEDQVYVLARKGKIPVVRVGGNVRFSRAALRNWIESQTITS